MTSRVALYVALGVATLLSLAGTLFLVNAYLKPDLPSGSEDSEVVEESQHSPSVDPAVPYKTPPQVDPHVKLLPEGKEAGEIIDLLRSDYLESASMVGQELTEADVDRLFSSPHPTLKISPYPAVGKIPDLTTMGSQLAPGVGCWRMATFSEKDIKAFISQITQWKGPSLQGLILDLRFFKDPNNFDGAAQFLSLFSQPGTTFFSVEGVKVPQKLYSSSSQPLPLPRGIPVVVVVNSQSRGAAEVVAERLRSVTGAIVLGGRTAGEAGLFTETQLQTGRFIRMAGARVRLADGSDLLGRPLLPDVRVAVDGEEEFRAYQGAVHLGWKALIANKTPDFEGPGADKGRESKEAGDEKKGEKKSSSKNKVEAKSSPTVTQLPRDLALQRAFDLIRGLTAWRKPVENLEGT